MGVPDGVDGVDGKPPKDDVSSLTELRLVLYPEIKSGYLRFPSAAGAY
jgi:hypothetical protein